MILHEFSRTERRFFLRRNKLGWLLLVISFCVGSLTLYWRAFGDEADNLVIGTLISRGSVLYRDIFSHHFPFPYYWSAAVIAVCGKSLFAARLSVWLFQIASFAVAMGLSRYYLSLGTFALIWSILKPFYNGHMVLYNAFCAPSILVIVAITMAGLQRQIDIDKRHACAIGVFATISLLSDPLSVYAIAVAILFLLSVNARHALMAVGIIAVGLGGYASTLVISGTWAAFFNNAIIFNAKIYSKYVYASPARFGKILTTMLTGLGITDGVWFNFEPNPSVSAEYGRFDSWFFTGFLYRFAVLAATVTLVMRREYRSAFFIYLCAASLLVIDRWDFRAQPFIMFSTMVIAAVICGEWRRKGTTPAARAVQWGVCTFVTAMLGWLLLQTTILLVQNRSLLGYRATFGAFESERPAIEAMLCGQKEVKLAIYPASIYYYWFLDRPPVSRYIFMYPWVAEIALPEVLADLQKKGTQSAVFIDNNLLWGKYLPQDYLKPLLTYLEKNYVQRSENLFISPALAAKCEEARR
jgi:hypothetical protein